MPMCVDLTQCARQTSKISAHGQHINYVYVLIFKYLVNIFFKFLRRCVVAYLAVLPSCRSRVTVLVGEGREG